MFVQVFQGPVADAGRVRALMDEWVADLAPGAEGWLGSTAGVTDDGELVVAARFESAEAAQRNSDRPEQGAWWEKVAAQFTAEPVFRDSTAVDVDAYGDFDAAGFVQVMQGRTGDPERSRALMAGSDFDWHAFRPDVLGSLNIEHPDGEWTMVNYFTSESAARAGEQKELPPEAAEAMAEMQSLSLGEPRFHDLTDPWLDSPA
jgi:hypothetical protein